MTKSKICNIVWYKNNIQIRLYYSCNMLLKFNHFSVIGWLVGTANTYFRICVLDFEDSLKSWRQITQRKRYYNQGIVGDSNLHPLHSKRLAVYLTTQPQVPFNVASVLNVPSVLLFDFFRCLVRQWHSWLHV